MASAMQHLALPEAPANEAPTATRRWSGPDDRLHTEAASTRASVTVYADLVATPTPEATRVLDGARARAIAAGFRVRIGDPRRLHAAIDAHLDAVAAVDDALRLATAIAEQGAELGVRAFVHLGRTGRAEPGPQLPSELDACIASQPEPGLWVGAAARRISLAR